MNNVKVPFDQVSYNSARKRDPVMVATSQSRDFGLNVEVRRKLTNPEQYPSGQPSNSGLDPYDNSRGWKYRDPFPAGQIGSSEGRDADTGALPQYLDTVARYDTEEKDPKLHNAAAALRTADRPIQLHSYAELQPRVAPIPRAAQDEGFLEGPASLAADPQMTDANSFKVLLPRDARRLDLYGDNVAGVLHNEGGQPKAEKVMGEFKRGKLNSGSGAKVKNRKQAIAIAMSEAGKSKK